MESWKETEGEDIEIRRAKLFKKIVENVPIKIHDFDALAGRLTPGVIGASTAIDIVGDYIPGIWNDDGKIRISITNDGTLSKEELEILIKIKPEKLVQNRLEKFGKMGVFVE